MGDARDRSPDVTVAVVVKDRRELMAACLDAIAALDPAPAEVVVVDNGSTDGTLQLVESRVATMPVPLRVCSVAGSIGRARNAALDEVRTAYVAFTDSDCAPEQRWLAAGLAGFGPGVGAVQGRTLPADDPNAAGRWSATQRIESFSHLYEACNLLYRAPELRAAGGFDETIGFFGEDTAAGWNLERAGWRGVFAPDAVVRHVVTQPGMAWHLRRGLGYANWNALIARYPEKRDLLWHRVFLRRRNAAFLAAAAGVAAVAARRPAGAALALPYLWLRRPQRPGLAGLGDSAAGVAYDAAVLAGLVVGSVRERTLVL